MAVVILAGALISPVTVRLDDMKDEAPAINWPSGMRKGSRGEGSGRGLLGSWKKTSMSPPCPAFPPRVGMLGELLSKAGRKRVF